MLNLIRVPAKMPIAATAKLVGDRSAVSPTFKNATVPPAAWICTISAAIATAKALTALITKPVTPDAANPPRIPISVETSLDRALTILMMPSIAPLMAGAT